MLQVIGKPVGHRPPVALDRGVEELLELGGDLFTGLGRQLPRLLFLRLGKGLEPGNLLSAEGRIFRLLSGGARAACVYEQSESAYQDEDGQGRERP